MHESVLQPSADRPGPTSRAREGEERLLRVLDTIADGVVIFDASARVAYLNPAARRLLPGELGWRFDDARWRLETVVGEPAGAAAFSYLAAARTGRSAAAEFAVRGADGGRAFLGCTAAPLRGGRGPVSGVVVTVRDVTQARRAEELRLERERLRLLSRRLVEVEEAERGALARELHDQVGQCLTALRVCLERDGGATDAVHLVRELAERVRDFSLDLRPSLLDDLGLVPALVSLFARHERQTGLAVRFEHSGLEGRLPSAVETAAFRLVQEALTNVVRHAGVREASVRLWRNEFGLHLHVADRGCGFDAGRSLADGNGRGLNGMRDRVLLLGGCFDLESAPESGCSVSVELPLLD
jgi:PAS domain S-box-containing protein